jgi:hypothetical protein
MNKVPSFYMEFIAGVRDELPILLGVIPFGMIYGVLAIAAGLPVGATYSNGHSSPGCHPYCFYSQPAARII